MPSACPYCGALMEPAPQRSRKCPECEQRIVVRTQRGTGGKQLLTVEEAARLDAQRKAKAARNKALRRIEWLGVTDRDFDVRERQLAEQWGTDPHPGDVFWSIANEKITALGSEGQWHELSMLYQQMGAHLLDEGKPHRRLQQQAHEAELRHLATLSEWEPEGRRRAVILANACCDACEQLDGQVFTFEEAMDAIPLPPEVCEREWCNCLWSATYLD